MLGFELHTRGVSRSMARLMAAVFAVQIMVGGFCLLTSEAYAMPMSTPVAGGAHCSVPAVHADAALSGHASTMLNDADHQHSSKHSGNCYHCDQPDELSVSSGHSVSSTMLVLADDVSLLQVSLLSAQFNGLFSTRTPTGPPSSSSLLYRTSQRILI